MPHLDPKKRAQARKTYRALCALVHVCIETGCEEKTVRNPRTGDHFVRCAFHRKRAADAIRERRLRER